MLGHSPIKSDQSRSVWYPRTSIPSTKTAPAVTSVSRCDTHSADLPEPVLPSLTIAVVVPAAVNEMSCSTGQSAPDSAVAPAKRTTPVTAVSMGPGIVGVTERGGQHHGAPGADHARAGVQRASWSSPSTPPSGFKRKVGQCR